MEQRIQQDNAFRRELSTLMKELRSLAISGIEFYENADGDNNERFYSSFVDLYDHLDIGTEPNVDYLLEIAHLYDFDAYTPGNGYRSMVQIIHKCCLHLITLSRYILLNKASFLFRSRHYSKELRAYVSTLGQLRACAHYLVLLVPHCEEGALFPDEDALAPENFKSAERLMSQVECLHQETFYGRCLAFQYCQSMVKPLSTINLAMASFGDGYNKSSLVMKFASSVIGGSRYLVDPELRAQQVVNLTRNGDIHFCKAFWQMNENVFLQNLPLFVCPPVHIDKVIVLEPLKLVLPRTDGRTHAVIDPPSAHTGPGPVYTRLISYEMREGQEVWREKGERLGNRSPSHQAEPKSPWLIIHLHGGGFVAQSSGSHEVYLRFWAKSVGAPIFSIDYSLAPEHYFPRQSEEIFYAYCWALKNAALLGSAAEHVCVTGDSAGGTLALEVAIQAKQCGIQVPAGVLTTYACMQIRYTPSPSRILSLMDPLLPIGILSKCLAAYAGPAETEPPRESSTPIPDLTVIPPPEPTNHKAVNQQAEAEMEEKKKSGHFICHKQNESADSGYQEGFLDTDSKFFIADDTDSQVLQENNTNHVRTPSNQVDSHAEKKPKAPKHSMRLDLSKKTRLNKSPSSPVLRTHHHHLITDYHDDDPVVSSQTTFAKMRHDAQSPMQQLPKIPCSTNSKMSPLLATDEELKGLCPVYLVACRLDPMLDDSVTFAKRLRSLKVPVHLDLLADLPHGFLNFVLISREAKKGSELCTDRILEILSNDSDESYVTCFDDESHKSDLSHSPCS